MVSYRLFLQKIDLSLNSSFTHPLHYYRLYSHHPEDDVKELEIDYKYIRATFSAFLKNNSCVKCIQQPLHRLTVIF